MSQEGRSQANLSKRIWKKEETIIKLMGSGLHKTCNKSRLMLIKHINTLLPWEDHMAISYNQIADGPHRGWPFLCLKSLEVRRRFWLRSLPPLPPLSFPFPFPPPSLYPFLLLFLGLQSIHWKWIQGKKYSLVIDWRLYNLRIQRASHGIV